MNEKVINGDYYQRIKISVIVPVYNAQQYLPRCLESIIGQTYKNLEIILVDDGSKDGSAKIMDMYAKKDARILLLSHAKNMGLVHARKTGVSHATGEYISYVDADDTIELTRCEDLLRKDDYGRTDIIWSDRVLVFPDGKQQKLDWKFEPGFYDFKSKKEKLLLHFSDINNIFIQRLPMSMCCGLISTKLLQKYQSIIPDEIRIGEDFACMLYCLYYASSVRIVDSGNYYYHKNSNSMTHEHLHDLAYKNYTSISNRYLNGVMREFLNKIPSDIYVYIEKEIRVNLYYNALIGDYSFLANQVIDGSIYPYGVPSEAKIIVYGAGSFGKQIYEYWKKMGHQIVAWCDRSYEKCQAEGWLVSAPNEILKLNFDYVIIAIGFYNIASKAAKSLVDLGVDERKICFMKATELEKAHLSIDCC